MRSESRSGLCLQAAGALAAVRRLQSQPSGSHAILLSGTQHRVCGGWSVKSPNCPLCRSGKSAPQPGTLPSGPLISRS